MGDACVPRVEATEATEATEESELFGLELLWHQVSSPRKGRKYRRIVRKKKQWKRKPAEQLEGTATLKTESIKSVPKIADPSMSLSDVFDELIKSAQERTGRGRNSSYNEDKSIEVRTTLISTRKTGNRRQILSLGTSIKYGLSFAPCFASFNGDYTNLQSSSWRPERQALDKTLTFYEGNSDDDDRKQIYSISFSDVFDELTKNAQERTGRGRNSSFNEDKSIEIRTTLISTWRTGNRRYSSSLETSIKYGLRFAQNIMEGRRSKSLTFYEGNSDDDDRKQIYSMSFSDVFDQLTKNAQERTGRERNSSYNEDKSIEIRTTLISTRTGNRRQSSSSGPSIKYGLSFAPCFASFNGDTNLQLSSWRPERQALDDSSITGITGITPYNTSINNDRLSPEASTSSAHNDVDPEGPEETRWTKICKHFRFLFCSCLCSRD